MSFIKKISGIGKFGEKTSSSGIQSKAKAGILHKGKTIDYNVYYEGEDLTPKPLTFQIIKASKERQMSINLSGIETSTTKIDLSFRSLSTAQRFRTELTAGEFGKSFMGTTIDDTFLLQSLITEGTESERIIGTPEKETIVEEKTHEIKPIPDHCSLILNETETFFVLDIPSASVIKDSEEGTAVEELNEQYQFMTEGKGRNRKTVEQEVQTHTILKKTRETEAVKVHTSYHSTFASNWEMYDTHMLNNEIMELAESQTEQETSHNLTKTKSIESLRFSPEEKEIQELMKNAKFLQAVTVIERLLANNNYNYKQQIFKEMDRGDDFGDDREYKYELNLLWTFANDQTTGKCVTSIDWNSSDEDILVVGYGKFYFTDKASGMTMVWNIKNPVQPERCYNFPDPVSAVAFSQKQPHLIAIGFNTGLIKVVDIRERKLKIVHNSSRENISSFECVNYLTFYSGDEHYNYEEQILACFNDGRVCKYRMNIMFDMPCIQIMRAPECDGKIKGIQKITICGVPVIPLTKYTGAIILTYHPEDPSIYYLSTTTGVLHKCSTNYFNQHLDLLLVHEGPIYTMKFSPFWNKIYATCSGDWFIRIWAEGITEPLLELVTTMHPVEAVLWSPTHSTILIAIQGMDVQIWDLNRKIHYPQNTIKNLNMVRNSIIQFTNNGRCLTVCDIEGNTHIYALENMPVPPFFQENMLFRVLKQILTTKPELLKKFLALRESNHEHSEIFDK